MLLPESEPFDDKGEDSLNVLCKRSTGGVENCIKPNNQHSSCIISCNVAYSNRVFADIIY